MHTSRFVGGALLALVFILSGCTDAGTNPQQDPGEGSMGRGEVRFSEDVLPILQTGGCTGCHGNEGGLSVRTVRGLLSGGEHGPAIVAGKPDSSILVRKLSSPAPFGARMPLGGSPLSVASVTVIREWITQGALDN